MTDKEHREIVTELLALVQQMEQLLKEDIRLLTSQDDGHCLETKSNKDQI